MKKVFKKGFGFVDSTDEIINLTAKETKTINDTSKTKPKRKSSANVKRVGVKRTAK